MQIKIYIQSRGYSPNNDYIWVKKRRNQQAEEIDSEPVSQDLPSIIYQAINLINTKESSVVLFREQSQLLLLLTGLPTERVDRQNRPIRNSVAWIGTDADEPILCEIAALVLENKFQIPESSVANSSNSPVGFNVNWKEIEGLIPKSGAEKSVPSANQNIGKIAFFSEGMKKELANILMTYDLPSRNGALVVVTEFEQIQKVFEEAKVWRGMSSDPSISPDIWQKLPSKPSKDRTHGKIDDAIKLLPEDAQQTAKEAASSAEDFFNSVLKNLGLGLFIFFLIMFWLVKRLR